MWSEIRAVEKERRKGAVRGIAFAEVKRELVVRLIEPRARHVELRAIQHRAEGRRYT